MSLVPPEGGVLPVDKPEGPTSHDVVALARRALDTRRIGHTGTLDPFASGLLLLCVGPATRLSEYLVGFDKEYLATARLGVRTTTDDREGDVVERREGADALSREAVRAAFEALEGPLSQVPPAFSAKKVRGQAAHRMARRGEAPELPPADVTVREIEVLEVDGADVRFRVRCSSGTYVRALARDAGEALGVGAHLTSLRRTRIGPFTLDGAVDGGAMEPDRIRGAWIDPLGALPHLPTLEVDAEDARRIASGQGVPTPGPGPAEGGPVAAVHGRALVAIGVREGASFRPRKVFVQP